MGEMIMALLWNSTAAFGGVPFWWFRLLRHARAQDGSWLQTCSLQLRRHYDGRHQRP